ncbi:MAG: CRISPR-associated endonuclease Cas2 [Thermoplasmataceae archaeon]
MHVIIAYDVEADRTQCFKKICQKFLPRIQNSVFEGDITKSQLVELKYALEKEVKENESVRIWRIADSQIYKTYLLGKKLDEDYNIM